MKSSMTPAPERPGPVERVQRDEVVEPFRLRLAQRVPHARALELEHAAGLTVAEELVRRGVVEGHLVERQRLALRLADVGHGVVEQGQRAQPEKVHLEQADPLDLLHGPLRGDLVLLALVERRELGDRLRRDDDAGRVHRGVPGHALQPARHANQLLDPRVAPVHLLERRALLHRPVERHVQGRRNLLRDAVDVRVGHAQRAAHVAHRGARLHGPEGDDLGHVLPAVLARDVLDDLAPPALAEVDVDVRQRDAFRVEETLEDEIELQRVDVGDLQAVRHQAAGGRAPARADRDAVLPRVADEVPDDEEVARVLHPLDDVDLVGEPRLVGLERMAQAPPRSSSSRNRGNRAAYPSRTTCSKYPSSVWPCGTSKFGRWFSPVLRSRSQRSAIATVLLSASG